MGKDRGKVGRLESSSSLHLAFAVTCDLHPLEQVTGHVEAAIRTHLKLVMTAANPGRALEERSMMMMMMIRAVSLLRIESKPLDSR